MTRKKARKEKPPGIRHGTMIRVADDVAADAKLVASFLGVSMAEYISDTLRPLVKEELQHQMRKRLAEDEDAATDPAPGTENE